MSPRRRRDADARLHKHAAWRARPATPKQLGMLLKLKGIKASDSPEGTRKPSIMVGGRAVDADTLTAGQVR